LIRSIFLALASAGFVTIGIARARHSAKSFRDGNRLDGARSAIVAAVMVLFAVFAATALMMRIV
jgi:hypothetical protein